MGSLIKLGLGALELDWGKNSLFANHSPLFLPNDIALAPYYYADEVIEEKRAFVRPLRKIVSRLEMLGYTLRGCEMHYESSVAAVPTYYPAPVLTYAQFAEVLQNVNANSVGLPEHDDYDLGEFVSKAIMCDSEFTKTAKRLGSLTTDDGTFFENLDPYVTLRLLAENPNNLDTNVIWRFAEVIEGGWTEETGLYEGVPREKCCLVVTEGSSDGTILRHALPVVMPDIADFFDFVDMSENYPFTGTGNLYRFCQGLARIGIQNRILIVLDNDTAGRDAYRRIADLKLPPRMKVAVLPDLRECDVVKTLGPSGSQMENINGRAVSIECFLDIWSQGKPEPVVRWTGYNESAYKYQGELLKKETYTRAFLESVRRGSTYDYANLASLWNHLVKVCTD